MKENISINSQDASKSPNQDKNSTYQNTQQQLRGRQTSSQFSDSLFEVNDEYEWSTQINEPKVKLIRVGQVVHNMTKFENPFRKKHNRRTSLQNINSQEKFTDILFTQVDESKDEQNSKADRCRSVTPDAFHEPLFKKEKNLPRKLSIKKQVGLQPELVGKIPSQIENNEIEEEDEQQKEQDDEDDEKEMTEDQAKNAALYKWDKQVFSYSKDKTLEEIMTRVKNFKVIEVKDEPRTDTANKDGGKQCTNKKMVKTIRAIGKQVIKEIGKKVLSGNFNLNTVAFPIRAMIPKSALEKALQATCLFPLYINKAAQIDDPVERVKLIICATIGNFYLNCSFLKPLNPILGESIQASYPDGTQLYAEQITHHPPMSYFLVYGPQKSYRFYGYYNYEASAGVNSVNLKNKGKRVIQFKDGQTVNYNFANEDYCGSFWGPMKVEVKGKMIFSDKENKIVAELEFDNVRWKPTDYFQGEIKRNGKRVSKINGSYMGFMEFDNQRYWDYRHVQPYQFQVQQQNELIKSDHQHRIDRKFLLKSNVDEAQKEKDTLENQQRLDAKNRLDYQKTFTKK